jgi:FPC/CPF motif-containing protein YcgG
MECDICQLKWSTENIIPLILPCGHTFCQSCILSQIKKANKKTFKCPACNTDLNSLKTEDDVLNLRKNSALLTLIDKVQTCKINNISNVSMSSQTLNASHINNQDNNNSRILQNYDLLNNDFYKNGEFFFPICQTHKNKANFYNIIEKNKNFYCNECIQTNVLENLKPLPFLKAQNIFKINSCKNKIKILRNEVNRVENFLKSYQKNFEITTKKKIEELFDFITKIIQYNYTMAKTLFQQCQKEQNNQIEQKTSELKFLLKELDSFEKKLENIIKPGKNKEKYIPDPESQITLDNVYNKLSNFINYGNELNLFQINISVKEEDKDALFNTLQNMCQLDIDFLKMKNGELPTIKELLNKSSTWPCDCGVLDNANGKIICKGCSKYRPLETYSNLVFNPLLAEKREIKEFNMRRKHEEKVYQSLAERNMDNLKHAYFFAIDSLWYNKWKSFINNDDKSSKYLENFNKNISENKKIGILPPGIIDNSQICEINNEIKGSNIKGGKYKLKMGLKKDRDYVIINQYLWEWFLLNYNGGPEIQLDDNFIINKNNKSQSDIFIGDNSQINENVNNSNKNKEEFEEKELIKSYIDINEKMKKYRKDMDNSEEINKFKKLDNSKLTDVKVPKQKKIEDN